MKKNIGLILPAYNEEGNLEKSIKNIEKGMSKFPYYKFSVYPVDDNSTDNTYKRLVEWQVNSKYEIIATKNSKNMGVAQSLKNMYGVIAYVGEDYILKTDMDSDFDQSVVLERLLPYVESTEKIVAGVRWREITKEENAYEVTRRNEVLEVLKREYGVTELDPPSVGSQLYEVNHLRKLMNHPYAVGYDRRWGFEFMLDLLSAKLEGKHPPIVKIEKGQYDPARRPKEKVDAQYTTYLQIMKELKR